MVSKAIFKKSSDSARFVAHTRLWRAVKRRQSGASYNLSQNDSCNSPTGQLPLLPSATAFFTLHDVAPARSRLKNAWAACPYCSVLGFISVKPPNTTNSRRRTTPGHLLRISTHGGSQIVSICPNHRRGPPAELPEMIIAGRGVAA